MNPTENKTSCAGEIDASLRVPLLALFGGAALWLVVGLVLGLIAGIKFHAPEFLGGCPLLTYGRVAPAANDAVLYGFCIPAALGVMLWIFARLSQMPLALPLVPVVAANLWHLGVFVGLGGNFARRKHRPHLAGISARGRRAVVCSVPAHRRFGGGHVRLAQ
jgi:cbb3-type cytochrome oxidase subunit 1